MTAPGKVPVLLLVATTTRLSGGRARPVPALFDLVLDIGRNSSRNASGFRQCPLLYMRLGVIFYVFAHDFAIHQAIERIQHLIQALL